MSRWSSTVEGNQSAIVSLQKPRAIMHVKDASTGWQDGLTWIKTETDGWQEADSVWVKDESGWHETE